MTATVIINGRRPRRAPHACLLQHVWWLVAAAVLLLRPSDHACTTRIFADASSIRRPGTSSRMTNNNNNGGTSKTTPPPAHCRPNRFVAASPLAAAAVCRDGVVMAAVHTSPALEPLLLVGAVGDGVQEEDDQEQEEDDGTPDHHLPRDYRGPFRVAPVDGYGTTLLSAGWRSDCHSLAAKCRSLAAEEAANYMHGDLGSGSAAAAAAPSEDYATGIASDAALWLAKCAISGGIRTRNCVGLLASCCTYTKADDDDDTTSNAAGRLYLIDAAGVHRVRALAMGHGSDDINRRLLGVDFAKLGRDEAVQKLMDVILQTKSQNGGGEGELNDGDDDDDDSNDTNTGALPDDTDAEGDQSSTDRWQPPKGSRVELAFVDAKRKQMTRINQRIQ